MSHLLQAYTVLAASSPRSEVAAALHALINGRSHRFLYAICTADHRPSSAQPFEIDEPERRETIQTILADLAKCTSSHGKGRLTTKGALPWNSRRSSGLDTLRWRFGISERCVGAVLVAACA